ncbi:hypothetical protein R1flu_017978 [Riccia fluitans]|uniref:Plant heme peroxidase family profile domain-containing protein n=1 Tax=Riccia fluitans TaxID=41844 RepID=A0ABD1ZFT9_9MARC
MSSWQWTNSIFLDFTADKFDRAYYKNVLAGRGVLITDSGLITEKSGEKIVTSFTKPESAFFTEFVEAMIKMGNLGVLTACQREIHKTYRIIIKIFEEPSN